MKVVFISSNYFPRTGGPASVVPELANALSKKMNVSVVAFRENGVLNYERESFELFRGPSFYWPDFSSSLSVVIRTALLCIYSRFIAAKKNPSIIHAHDSHISAVAALFCKLTSFNKKVIVKYSGDSVFEFSCLKENKAKSIEDLFKQKSLKQAFLKFFQKIIFLYADVVHVQNEYQKKVLLDNYSIPKEKVFVLPNPVDLSKFKQFNQKIKKKKIILMISRLVPWKGHETMLSALLLVRKKIRGAKLVIAGDGSKNYVQKLKSICKKEKLDESVIFLGKVSRKDLPLLYNEASVFVQPSLYEPFGLSVLEALACNTPIVASNTGGLPELLNYGKEGFLFECGNKKQLAELIIKSFNSKKTRTNLSDYNIESVSAQLYKKYKQILHPKK